jgi:beta-phosphoglucomutase
MSKLKGVIFDMDGVITETSEYHYMAWKLLAGHIGIYIDRRINEQLKGISRMDSLDVILKHGNRENDFTETEKLALATSKNKRYVEMINQFTKDNLLEGVEELLKSLKERGIKVAIASASRSALNLTRLLEIEDYIDFIVDPESVPGKPAPDIFLAAAEGLGLSPCECIGVEDAYAGVEAIKSANMYAVGIGLKDNLPQADMIYEKPKDVDVTKLIQGFESYRP